MAIALLTILLVLVLTALAPELARLRQFLWLRELLGWVDARLGPQAFWRSELGLVLVILPLVAVTAAIDRILAGLLHGLLDFVFGFVVLFLCWGPRDLDADASHAARAGTAADRAEALSALGTPAGDRPVRSAELVDSVFHAGLARWFGPMFWFVVFGPAGAVLYRVTQLLAQSSELEMLLAEAQRVGVTRFHDALAWLPAQLMTLALALASDFDAVGKAWRSHHEAHGQGFLHLDLGFLSATARACVEVDDVEFVADDGAPIRDPAVEEARRLLWRVAIVWLAVLAIVVLAGWSS
jgi:AmpE protein